MTRRTADDIFHLVEKQVLPAITALQTEQKQLKNQVVDLKDVVRNSGLNGYSVDFKRMVDEYRVSAQRRENWAGVRADIADWLGFLQQPRKLIGLIIAAAISALAWKVISSIHLPPPF